ncbi:MAG: glycosyltransferase family 2 protein [Flavobacteriaceae bacterium]
MTFKTYTTKNGEELLYRGNPSISFLEAIAEGVGDIWHSSLDQGYKNIFPEIIYQTAVFFWYGRDFDNLDICVSWRLNPTQFVVRKSVWNELNNWDNDFESEDVKALDYAYNALRNLGVIPLYVKGLFDETAQAAPIISTKDRYLFFIKNFKKSHSFYMLFREGIYKLSEWKSLFWATKNFKQRALKSPLKPRELKPIDGSPSISYIIPTMLRQDYTLQLLEDLKSQSYLPKEVVVVDATPLHKRDEQLYNSKNYPFDVIFQWQTTKGSCRARNEAIDLCSGEYIVFGDDDIRLSPNFLENHIRLLQTYKAGACNGLDIRADHQKQNLDDLNIKLADMGDDRWKVGATQNFSNANSCVKKEYVDALVGNDINYDGGYGEDSDFGISLTKRGITVLHNPFSTNLHLKPPVGGYRFWGEQAKLMGKQRKRQPWELDSPVKFIRPVPSPTIMYQLYKQFDKEQRKEYKIKYFVKYLTEGNKVLIILRIIKFPFRMLQYRKSVFYAKQLIKLGVRTK